MSGRSVVVAGSAREAARLTVRRSPAGRVAPLPTGPGRAPRVAAGSARRARPAPVRRLGPASCPVVRVVAGRVRPVGSSGGRRVGRRGLGVMVLAGVVSAMAVFGLGALADAMASIRVPDVTGPVVVRADETLWQLAHRAAPSAEPAAVVRRIVELNDLESPSVRAGQVLVSPIG